MIALEQQELKPVRKIDIVPHAKANCRTCSGAGLFSHTTPSGIRSERLCKCALRRFLKLGTATVNTETGQLFFKPLSMKTLAALSSADPKGEP